MHSTHKSVHPNHLGCKELYFVAVVFAELGYGLGHLIPVCLDGFLRKGSDSQLLKHCAQLALVFNVWLILTG